MVSVILFAIMIAMLDRVPGSFEMTGTKTENSRPNIIVILIDDQDWVLGGLVRKREGNKSFPSSRVS